MRCLKKRSEEIELVSVDGTHLGHKMPSESGINLYRINLSSIAGRPIIRKKCFAGIKYEKDLNNLNT